MGRIYTFSMSDDLDAALSKYPGNKSKLIRDGIRQQLELLNDVNVLLEKKKESEKTTKEIIGQLEKVKKVKKELIQFYNKNKQHFEHIVKFRREKIYPKWFDDKHLIKFVETATGKRLPINKIHELITKCENEQVNGKK